MIHFGTGGWRAVIGDEFIKSNLRQLALMISHIAYEESDKPSPIAVGYDNRFLSKEASEWMIEIFNELGIDTLSYPFSIPTPLLMHYVKVKELDYGVMITASHNPYQYNGVKIIVKGGLDAPKELTDRFEDTQTDWFTPITSSGKNSYIENPYDLYKEDILDFVDREAIKEYSKNLHIAFDGMHGSGSNLFLHILSDLDIDYSEYDTNIDPYFNNGKTQCPEPSAENCQAFVKWFNIHNSQAYVSQQLELSSDEPVKPFNLGLVFDGDGDRLMVVDETGAIISMNQLLCLFYWYLHKYCNESGPVIRNVVTTSVLDRMATVFEDKLIEVPVGFKWVTSAMNEHNGLLGGESSGGFALRGHIYGKDSILASVFLINLLCKTQQTLSELLSTVDKRFGTSVFLERKIPLSSNDKKQKLMEYINALDIPGATVSNLDGKKFIVGNGRWVSFRFSGTEPILRVMVEAPNKYEAEETVKKVLAALPN